MTPPPGTLFQKFIRFGGGILPLDLKHYLTGWQELTGLRRGEKMPSIFSSKAYLLICDKKSSFFAFNQEQLYI